MSRRFAGRVIAASYRHAEEAAPYPPNRMPRKFPWGAVLSVPHERTSSALLKVTYSGRKSCLASLRLRIACLHLPSTLGLGVTSSSRDCSKTFFRSQQL